MALSLTRGRVCRLQLLLPVASAVILGTESRGVATIFYRHRFETSLFIASYDSQDYGGGILTRLHTEIPFLASVALLITHLHGPSRKHCFQQYLSCCMRIRCRGNVFTELLLRNGFTRCNRNKYTF
jgi:hypothetical protein